MHFKNPFGKGKHSSFDEKEPLSDYDVGETLGEGGYGTVKQAHQKGADEGMDVAIKIVPKSALPSDRDSTKEIKRRLKMMKEMAVHPHIIRLLDWRITKTTIFTFYEFCKGKDLFDRILDRPNGRFTEAQAQLATRALTDALDYLHDRNLMHRDVKPENVLYRTIDGPFDDLVLADFGLSFEIKPGETVEGAAGSPGYWSPEMCANKGYGLLADEWALGIVVYAMLSGRSPFRALEADELRKECAKAELTYPSKYFSHVSEAGLDFLKGLLQKEPSERMTVKQALKHKWLTEPVPEEHAAPPAEAKTAEQEEAGKLERRPTHGLSPAGVSLRFDKPPEPVDEEHEDDGPSLTSRQTPSVHIMQASDVLTGNVDPEKLAALAKLDDQQHDSTEAPTPTGPRSREGSQTDLAKALAAGLDELRMERNPNA